MHFGLPRTVMMNSEALLRLRHAIRDVPDFPQPGVLFKDITPVLGDAGLLTDAVEAMAGFAEGLQVDKVVGIDARGFIFGAMLAARLKCGFVPARKKGKLPWHTKTVDYALEYGSATLEMHEDAILKGEKVLLADDLLATGGTAGAALALMEGMGAEVLGSVFFIELAFLSGREKVEKYGPVQSVLTF
jgi:adenine phosphoribosyltransferase